MGFGHVSVISVMLHLTTGYSYYSLLHTLTLTLASYSYMAKLRLRVNYMSQYLYSCLKQLTCSLPYNITIATSTNSFSCCIELCIFTSGPCISCYTNYFIIIQ